MRYQIECLDPRANQPFGVMNDGDTDIYADAVEKLRDFADSRDYHRDSFPVMFRIKDTAEDRVLDFCLIMKGEIKRWRIDDL